MEGRRESLSSRAGKTHLEEEVVDPRKRLQEMTLIWILFVMVEKKIQLPTVSETLNVKHIRRQHLALFISMPLRFILS